MSPPIEPARAIPGTWRASLAVAGVELRSAARDRQVLLYTVLLPLALYPVLLWVVLQFHLVRSGREEATAVRVVVAAPAGAADARRVADALAADPESARSPGPVEVELRGDLPAAEAEALLRTRAGAARPEADAVLRLGAEGSELLHDETRSRSELARERVRERLGILAEALRAEALDAAPESLHPFGLETADVASARARTGFVLSFLLPMLLVLMAVMGGFFPAVDATAGEKERGTAETTMLLPVPRSSVVAGKVLAVSAAALVATVLNAVGLLVAAESLLAGVGEAIAVEVPWEAFLRASPLLLLFLLSTSAILVALASLTRTFKQGQALLGGVQMLFVLPAVVAAMPGIEPTATLAVVPVVQTVVAFKAILQGSALAPELLLLTFGTQALYAALSILLAARLASRESLLFGGAAVSLRALARHVRAAGAPR